MVGVWINRNQCVGVSSEPKPGAGAWEFDDERASLERGDASDSQLRVETVGEVIPAVPITQLFFGRGGCQFPIPNFQIPKDNFVWELGVGGWEFDYRARSAPLTRSNTRSGGGNPFAFASSAAFS